MNGTLPSALVHRPPKVITPPSRHAPRARLRQDKPPRAHIECAPTDSVSDQRDTHKKTQPRYFTVKWRGCVFCFGFAYDSRL